MTNNIKSDYYAKPSYDSDKKETFYVRMSKFIKPKLEFKTLNGMVEFKYTFCLEGDYKEPPELLLMSIQSTIGNFKNISVLKTRSDFDLNYYTAKFIIYTNESEYLKNPIFNNELDMVVSLDVNKNVYNSNNLKSPFDRFVNELRQIQLINRINYSNYFPINMLNEYYISSKYKNFYDRYEVLPEDFFTWCSNSSIIKPEFYFMKNNDFTDIPIKPITKLYKVNKKDANFKNIFDKSEILIEYEIDNKTKILNLDLTKQKTHNENDNTLSLNIRTLYNHEAKELIQVNNSTGVQGIYFPIPITGKLKIKFVKNNLTYIDNINFSFKNHFYSKENKELNYQIIKFENLDVNWKEVSYA